MRLLGKSKKSLAQEKGWLKRPGLHRIRKRKKGGGAGISE
jgi:hypothetical protein